MPNKKTVKRNKRNSKRSRSRKGGFFGFFDDKHNEADAACNPNDLANLKDSNSIHANYQTCCPKTWYGRKNNSPYCKQLDLNYKAAFQSRQNDINLNKQAITSTVTRDSVNGVTVDVPIDCKNPNLYNTEEEMKKYVETCECNKVRYNPFSEKKANCAIVNPRLAKLQTEERPTEVLNPIQQNNQYMPVNQYEEEVQEKDTIATPVNAPPEGDWKEMKDYEPDPNPNNKEIDTVGGKKNKTRRKSMKRKTKKHFKKRSTRKRKGRKY